MTLSHELLAPVLIESWSLISTGKLLALVFLEMQSPFSINELVAPLDYGIATALLSIQ
jgi:hypothetical protein